ncbi:hypothetical protein MCOR25_000733 [Pyricularia grisea]|nr:hypothetical protein MCOR25_000733 [Pyricularia grisea]
MRLEYSSCTHSIKPRVLHEESVLMLPDTVKCSDQLPECCPSCRRAAAVKHASKLFSVYHTEIDAANRAFQESKSEDDREKLSAADKKAHRIILSSFNLQAQFDCLIPNLKTPGHRHGSKWHYDYQRLRSLAMTLSSRIDALISSFQLAAQCLKDGNQSEFDRQHRAQFEDGSPAGFSHQLSDMSKRLALGELRANILREPDMARWYGDAIVISRALGLWQAAVRDRAGLPRSDEYGTMAQIAEKLDKVYRVGDLEKIKRRIEILAQRALTQNGAGNKPSRGAKRPAEQLTDDGKGKDDGNLPPARFRRTDGGRIAITSTRHRASSGASDTVPLPGQQDTDMAGVTVHDDEGHWEGEGENYEGKQAPKILSRACIERPFPFVINNSAGFQNAWKTVQLWEKRLKGPRRRADHDRDLKFMNVLVKELYGYALDTRAEFKMMKVLKARNLRYLQFCEAPEPEIQNADAELKRMDKQYDRDDLGFDNASERNACCRCLTRLYAEAGGYDME